MAKMIVKKDTGWTRNVLMCDLHRTAPGCGEGIVGKARITFFVPMEPKESDDVGTMQLKEMYKSINVDVLWFSQYEKGWVEGYISDDDIPDEDEEINLVPQKKQEPQVQKTNAIEKTEVKVDNDPVSDLPFDDGSEEQEEKSEEEDIDDLLSDEEETSPVKKEEPKGEILEAPKDPMKTETSDDDIDKLLDDIL